MRLIAERELAKVLPPKIHFEPVLNWIHPISGSLFTLSRQAILLEVAGFVQRELTYLSLFTTIIGVEIIRRIQLAEEIFLNQVWMQIVLEFYGFVVLYLLIFLMVGGWFFLDGAITCFISSRRQRDWVLVKA
jgi:hypothetical protein